MAENPQNNVVPMGSRSHNMPPPSNFQYEEIEVGDFDNTFLNNEENDDSILSTTLRPTQKNEQFVMRLPKMQSEILSKITILTGNIAQILKWNQVLNNFQLFETIGIYVSDWDSGNQYQKILLIRQPRWPVLKVKILSNRYPKIPYCNPGHFLRVIGRITDENMMVAYKVTKANEIDFQRLEKAALVCERIFKHRTSQI